MGAAHKIIDKKTLQILVPFNALSPMHFNEVAQKTVVEEVRAGRLVFKEGDRDNQSVYLLEGEISLVTGNEVVGAVSAGSDASRHPLAHQQPRQVSARAKTNVVVARVDSSLLDIMLTWDQSSGYEVAEIDDDDDDDWMTRILQSQAFLKLPPSNIQRLLMKVESVPVHAGEVIIRQGGEGDYFYIIKNGRCMVSRKPSANAKEVKLAELADGDAFGEDALVSDAKRNATITMITDGVLMRLAKKDFVELLKEPLLNKLAYADAAALAGKGAVWLDVRLPGEFENVRIPDSRNIPLSALRLEANGLDARRKYIVCCDTGRRSASAAFVLSQRGFEVYVLSEGLGGVPADILEGNAATTAANQAAAEPAAAEVVALKPHPAVAVPEAAAVSGAPEIPALQAHIEALRSEKQSLESAHTQLSDRVSDLQLELERVREEAREQILELEHTLADARKEGAAAQGELQVLKETQTTGRQAQQAAREHADALETELTERRAREDQLQAELKAQQARLAELESAHQEDLRLSAQAEIARAGHQEQIESLNTRLQQADERLIRITELEATLQETNRDGSKVQADQARRIDELEAALQVATAALERTQQEAEGRFDALAATQRQEVEQARVAADRRITELQAQLDSVAAERGELEARLTSAGEALVQSQQSEQARLSELQASMASLTAELEQVRASHAEQQAQAAAAEHEVAALRETQAEALAVAEAEMERLRAEHAAALALQTTLAEEHAALQSQQEAAALEHKDLQDALSQAQARIQTLQADAGEQVKQLEGALTELRGQLEGAQRERTAQQDVGERLAHERDELQAVLEQAQARIQTLETQTGEQLDVLGAERDRLRQEHMDVTARLDAAAARIVALEQDAESRSGMASALQQQVGETQRELETAQQTAAALQVDYATAQSALIELETRLAASEQDQTRLLSEHQAEIEALRTELSASAQTRTDLTVETERRIRELEEALTAARADAGQSATEQRQALTDAQQQRDRAEHALTEAKAELDRLAVQQADAASSQDEQTQLLAQLREESRTAQAQLQAADAARGEIEARLEEMTAAAHETRSRLEQSQLEHRTALDAAEQRGRAALEEQLDELRSELESTRAALARELSERGNLEQATQAEFESVQADLEAALEQVQTSLQESEQALVTARASEQELATELASARAAAESQQQALVAELEQLRMATTADIEATQKQLSQLKEELKAARKLSAGGSAAEELERMRLLLDEAREEANAARGDAEQWREHALSGPAVPPEQTTTDELAAMRVQLADIQSRVDDATQLRDTAQEEVAKLRQELQAQQLRQSMQGAQAVRVDAPAQDAPARRGGLWMGLVAGLLVGVLGAGGFLWYGQAGQVPVQVNPGAESPKAAQAPAKPVAAAQPLEEPQAAASVSAKAADEEPVGAPASKRRELYDSLGDGSRGPVLIEIVATSYSMGSGISSLDFDERPKHDVKLRRFAIGKFEVTFDEYDAFARLTGRALPDDKGWGRGRRPVINVSWEEAVAYTQWLSDQTGKRYRLPTEAEWEYAAGGAERTLYWWGNTPGEARANCFNCGSEWDAHLTAPVGSFAANPLGLFDTSGNVSEWVQDCYHPSYEGAPRDGSAWVNVGCTRRVVRSGGFNSPANTLRITKRDQQLASMRADDLGFRIVREF